MKSSLETEFHDWDKDPYNDQNPLLTGDNATEKAPIMSLYNRLTRSAEIHKAVGMVMRKKSEFRKNNKRKEVDFCIVHERGYPRYGVAQEMDFGKAPSLFKNLKGGMLVRYSGYFFRGFYANVKKSGKAAVVQIFQEEAKSKTENLNVAENSNEPRKKASHILTFEGGYEPTGRTGPGKIIVNDHAVAKMGYSSFEGEWANGGMKSGTIRADLPDLFWKYTGDFDTTGRATEGDHVGEIEITYKDKTKGSYHYKGSWWQDVPKEGTLTAYDENKKKRFEYRGCFEREDGLFESLEKDKDGNYVEMGWVPKAGGMLGGFGGGKKEQEKKYGFEDMKTLETAVTKSKLNEDLLKPKLSTEQAAAWSSWTPPVGGPSVLIREPDDPDKKSVYVGSFRRGKFEGYGKQEQLINRTVYKYAGNHHIGMRHDDKDGKFLFDDNERRAQKVKTAGCFCTKPKKGEGKAGIRRKGLCLDMKTPQRKPDRYLKGPWMADNPVTGKVALIYKNEYGNIFNIKFDEDNRIKPPGCRLGCDLASICGAVFCASMFGFFGLSSFGVCNVAREPPDATPTKLNIFQVCRLMAVSEPWGMQGSELPRSSDLLLKWHASPPEKGVKDTDLDHDNYIRGLPETTYVLPEDPDPVKAVNRMIKARATKGDDGHADPKDFGMLPLDLWFAQTVSTEGQKVKAKKKVGPAKRMANFFAGEQNEESNEPQEMKKMETRGDLDKSRTQLEAHETAEADAAPEVSEAQHRSPPRTDIPQTRAAELLTNQKETMALLKKNPSGVAALIRKNPYDTQTLLQSNPNDTLALLKKNPFDTAHLLGKNPADTKTFCDKNPSDTGGFERFKSKSAQEKIVAIVKNPVDTMALLKNNPYDSAELLGKNPHDTMALLQNNPNDTLALLKKNPSDWGALVGQTPDLT
jgi:hypothetical protein